MGQHEQFVLQTGGGLRRLAKKHDLKLREVTVLSTLVLFDGVAGCHPTQDQIAEAAGTTRGVVTPALKNLEAAGLIAKKRTRYRDSRNRECHSKNHLYDLSEEIGKALEFAAETVELRRRATQPQLFSSDQMRATVDPIWNPDARDCRSDMDQVVAPAQQRTQPSECQMRATVDPIWNPDVIDSRSDMDQMRATVDPYIGGGGGKDQYMPMIKSFTPTTPPQPQERDLSMDMLTHPAIAMPRHFAQAIAARWSPREILDRCQAYSADYNADGGVRGVGALIYRFAHADEMPTREVRHDDAYDYDWYRDYEYLVGLQDGRYEPYPEEEEEPEEAPAPVEEPPRSALVPADTMSAPDAVAAVYNTLEIDDSEEDDVDDVSRARVSELREQEEELKMRLHDRREPVSQHEYDAMRDSYQAIGRQRRRIEKQWSDEFWHERARGARAKGERLVDVLVDLIAQRWPDFPYQIEWPLRLEQMADAYRQAGRRGRELLDDILAASSADDTEAALIQMIGQCLTAEGERDRDDHVPTIDQAKPEKVAGHVGRTGAGAKPPEKVPALQGRAAVQRVSA